MAGRQHRRLRRLAAPALQNSADGFGVGVGGAVVVGEEFTRLEAAWGAGIAATVRAGAPVVVDDVFLGAAASQQRWRAALDGPRTAWVGVHCDAAVAGRREASRADREPGMAARQATAVHPCRRLRRGGRHHPDQRSGLRPRIITRLQLS